MSDEDLVLDDFKINNGTLNSLLQFDESLRTGRLSELLPPGADCQPTEELELGQTALKELEAAIPRRVSVMPSWAPQRIGRFEIRSVLGAGGFAVVYLAFDSTLNRQIALKVPRPHALIRPELRRRFVIEAKAAAQLDHPNIVPVFEAGEDRDLPYIACALCEGPTLAPWLSSRTTPMQPKIAARVVHDLAAAVQFSHDRGILHRDIKPGNVLLFPDSSKENDLFPFVPRLADFGLAKLLESGQLDSVTSLLIGTPRYMAPELIGGAQGISDVSPDIYALGALLYCLLLGQPPFGAATPAETVRRIAEDEPVSPDLVDPSIGRDLSLVCLKCLQKSPTLRYLSASELAEDLNRYLSGRPVLARQTPILLQFEKWCRRKPTVAALLALTASLGLLLFFLAFRYTNSLRQHVVELNAAVNTANRNKSESDENRRVADQQVFAADLKLADSLREFSDIHSASNILDKYLPNPGANAVVDGSSSFAWRYLKHQTTRTGLPMADTGQTVWDVQFSPQGDRIAQCGNKGLVRILDVENDYRLVLERQLADTEFNCLAWCETSPILATGGDDGLVRIVNVKEQEIVRNVANAVARSETGHNARSETGHNIETGHNRGMQVVRTLEAFPGQHVHGLAFLPQSSQLYVGGVSAELQVWDAESGQLKHKLLTPHTGGIEHLVVSKDGTRIVTGGDEGNICVWRTEDHSLLWQMTAQRGSMIGPVTIVRLTPDGRRLIAAVLKETILMCDAETGVEQRRWQGLNRIHSLAVDNERIVCGDSQGMMSELAIEDKSTTWRPGRQWIGHRDKISTIVLASDSHRMATQTDILSTDRAGNAWRWKRDPHRDHVFVPGFAPKIYTAVNTICWKDSTTLFQVSSSGINRVDIRTGIKSPVFHSDAVITGCRYSKESDTLVVGDDRGQLTVIHGKSSPQPPLPISEDSITDDWSINSNATRAVVHGPSNEVAVVDLQRNTVLMRLPDREASMISPDGRWFVSGNRKTDSFDVFDGESLQLVQSLKEIDPTAESITFSDDSRLFASTGRNRIVTVWSWGGANRGTLSDQYPLLRTRMDIRRFIRTGEHWPSPLRMGT